jgi:DMSO/TMAO reductase YedYZ molybdopterin-dependent catalytic subunit
MFNFSNSNRKETEERMRREGRLPPGQALTDKFPVLHYGPIPAFDESSWDFRLWGSVEKETRLSWAEFGQLPRTMVKMDLHCVTHWSKFDTAWEGVSLHTLIEAGLLKLKADARFAIQHAENDFSANLPLVVVLSDNFLLATHYNGQPITPEHGYPLRGIVGAIPGRRNLKDVYFWKGAKWLRGLEFSATDRKGFWEMAGYHNDADIWKEERIG